MKYGSGFSLLRDNIDRGAHPLPVSSQTLNPGDLIDLAVDSETWTAVTSSSVSYTRKALVIGACTTADSEVLAIELDGSEDMQVQSANSSDAASNGQRQAATDKNTVNNSGTDVTTTSVVFLQRGVLGSATDNQIWGNVLVGNGVVSTVS